MYQMYGIPNCNTVKKAKDFLEEQGVEYSFFNFKKETPNKTMLKRWKSFFGDFPANKRGPTFRKIKEDYEAANAAGKESLLLENLSAIKRPILEKDGEVLAIGFDEEVYQSLF